MRGFLLVPILLFAACTNDGPAPAQTGASGAQPNILLIVSDDQGWADLSCQDSVDDIRTPHIDALADRGVRCAAEFGAG